MTAAMAFGVDIDLSSVLGFQIIKNIGDLTFMMKSLNRTDESNNPKALLGIYKSIQKKLYPAPEVKNVKITSIMPTCQPDMPHIQIVVEPLVRGVTYRLADILMALPVELHQFDMLVICMRPWIPAIPAIAC